MSSKETLMEQRTRHTRSEFNVISQETESGKTFQQNNHKHLAKITQHWFLQTEIVSDSLPIENLQRILKVRVQQSNPH